MAEVVATISTEHETCSRRRLTINTKAALSKTVLLRGDMASGDDEAGFDEICDVRIAAPPPRASRGRGRP